MRGTDRISMLTPQLAADGAFRALNGVQNADPAAQVAGLALALRVFCEELFIKPEEELLRTIRFERDCAYRNENTIDAVRQYVRGELRRIRL
jgi:hypothetical protein